MEDASTSEEQLILKGKTEERGLVDSLSRTFPGNEEEAPTLP